MTERDDYLWDPAAEPDPEIVTLEHALRPLRHEPRAFTVTGESPVVVSRRGGGVLLRRTTLAAASIVLVAAIGTWAVAGRAPAEWRVDRLEGTPVVETRFLASSTVLTVGARLETNDASAARIAIGRIGTAEVGPRSRVRLVRARGSEHRLALERGTLHARVWAPPRYFVVETPAAVAVDLGCVYTLRVNDDGSGVLTVISGQVELVHGGRRSLVAAGTAADMRPGSGPGTPYPVGSSDAFRAALDTLDFVGGDAGALDAVLREAQGRSTITLWHLLPRLTPDARERVYARLAAMAPPPSGVTRDGVLALDERMLARWRATLEPTWSDEEVPFWKRTWRRVWTYATARS